VYGETSTGENSAFGASPAPPPLPPDFPAENLSVITKVVHEVLDLVGPLPDDDLRESVKRFCAEQHIAYDSRTVAKACDVARAQRRRRARSS
jgi:hypothetical protein